MPELALRPRKIVFFDREHPWNSTSKRAATDPDFPGSNGADDNMFDVLETMAANPLVREIHRLPSTPNDRGRADRPWSRDAVLGAAMAKLVKICWYYSWREGRRGYEYELGTHPAEHPARRTP